MSNITSTEAQALVDRFKNAVEEHEMATFAVSETEVQLREIVYVMHEGKIWTAMGYSDFKSFINKVLPVSKSQVYRLIENREVELSLGDAVGGIAPMSGKVLGELGKIGDVEERKRVVNYAKSKGGGEDGDPITITKSQVAKKKVSEKVDDESPGGTDDPSPSIEPLTTLVIAKSVLGALRQCAAGVKELQQKHGLHSEFPQQILVDIASAGKAVKSGIEEIE